MEDSDVEDLSKETLEAQYSIVREKTDSSHVQVRFFPFAVSLLELHWLGFQEYGDLAMGKMKVSEFQGYKKHAPASKAKTYVSPLLDAVPSEDVPLEILRQNLKSETTIDGIEDIQRQIRHVEEVSQNCNC